MLITVIGSVVFERSEAISHLENTGHICYEINDYTTSESTTYIHDLVVLAKILNSEAVVITNKDNIDKTTARYAIFASMFNKTILEFDAKTKSFTHSARSHHNWLECLETLCGDIVND